MVNQIRVFFTVLVSKLGLICTLAVTKFKNKKFKVNYFYGAFVV